MYTIHSDLQVDNVQWTLWPPGVHSKPYNVIARCTLYTIHSDLQVDILVNIAGVKGEQDWEAVYDINLVIATHNSALLQFNFKEIYWNSLHCSELSLHCTRYHYHSTALSFTLLQKGVHHGIETAMANMSKEKVTDSNALYCTEPSLTAHHLTSLNFTYHHITSHHIISLHITVHQCSAVHYAEVPL